MQVNHQLAGHPDQGPVVLMQHAPQVMSFGVSNMKDIPQELQLLDAVRLNRVEMPEAYHEGLNDVREVSGHTEEKQPVYQRMKWTDDMVKLLITALSYIGEDPLCNEVFVRKGKWRAISCVMSERGHRVSPQQCEDKFNDLNKKFKRLNDVLGRGTACDVVENPVLLETMDLSYNLKEEMNKLIGSRQLFYQEMCSYNNRNRLSLPHDQEVQQSVFLAVRGKYKYETGSMSQDLPSKRKIRGEERVSKRACASLECAPTADPYLVQDMPAKRQVGGERNLNMAPGSMSQDLPLKRKIRGEESVLNLACSSLECAPTAGPYLVQDMPAKRKVGGEERKLNMAPGSMSQDLPLKRKIRGEERVSKRACASLECAPTADPYLVQDMPAKRKVGGERNLNMAPGSMSQGLPLKRKIRGEERVLNLACASLECAPTAGPYLVQDMPAKRKVGGEERKLNMAPGSMSQDLPLKRKIRGEERVSNMACASLECAPTAGPYLVQDMPAKRKVGGEEINLTRLSLNGTTALDPDTNLLHPKSSGIHFSMNNEEKEKKDEHILPRLLQLEEQKLQIQAQILELEKQRFNFMSCCSKEDKELQKMLMDNEVIRLENQQLMLELKRGGTKRLN